MKTGLLIGVFVASFWDVTAQENLLLTYFKGNGRKGVYACSSSDGLVWQKLNKGKPIITPAVDGSLMRDPCVFFGPDSLYHLVWTAGWKANTIGYANSKNLVEWSNQQMIQLFPDSVNVRNCWAPEITYDELRGQFVIYWSSTIPGKFPDTDDSGDHGYNHRIYYTTTNDFQIFTSVELLYEHGFNVIDGTIVKDENRFVMFLKDETRRPAQKNIRLALAKDILGPYSKPSEPITGNYWAEGPTCVKFNGQWFMYFDKYVMRQMGLLVSDDLHGWANLTRKLRMPIRMRHGTVINVPSLHIENLK